MTDEAVPQIVHRIPGRVRLSVPRLTQSSQRQVDVCLREMRGVKSVRSDPLTGTAVVGFDPSVTSDVAILRRLEGVCAPPPDAEPDHPVKMEAHYLRHHHAPKVLRDTPVGRNGRLKRARIAVPGIDRNPQVARRAVDLLRDKRGVQVEANPLTGRVLVEYDEEHVDIWEIVSLLERAELPELAEEDHPRHPLDPAPLVQSSARAVASGLGLTLLASRRLAGASGAIVPGPALAYVSGTIALLQGIPPLRNMVRTLVGRYAADLALGLPDVVLSALGGNYLPLVLSALGSAGALSEVRARREAYRRYEERTREAPSLVPGSLITLNAGDCLPHPGLIHRGWGTAIGDDGYPIPVYPGARLPGGARLNSQGPVMAELLAGETFDAIPRLTAPTRSLYRRYHDTLEPASIGYAVLLGLVKRDAARVFEGLLLTNPRAATIGGSAADTASYARLLRAGVVIVGSRSGRKPRRMDVLVLASPRLLTDGLEMTGAIPLRQGCEASDVLALCSSVAAACGWPWGGLFASTVSHEATNGRFDGTVATATVGGEEYRLRPQRTEETGADALRARGDIVLALERIRGGTTETLGAVGLRPRLAQGALSLVAACSRHGVELVLLSPAGSRGATAVASRAGIGLVDAGGPKEAVRIVREHQSRGKRVGYVADGSDCGEAFAACDLAIGLSSGRSGRFAARADILAPDLTALEQVVETGVLRSLALRDALALSVASNVFGAAWGLVGIPGVERASRGVYVAAIAAVGAAWLRLRGGERVGGALHRLADPRPEQVWGGRTVEESLAALSSSPEGLSSQEADRRLLQFEPGGGTPSRLPSLRTMRALSAQARSPLVGILAAGAGFSLFLGTPMDFALIVATILANVAFGLWQERQADEAARALSQMASPTGRVLRDGFPAVVPSSRIVPGDVLVLAPGDRIAADARILQASSLEVDEAALTGESLPVPKSPAALARAGRIVLEGSDVTVGSGSALVVAVGSRTRMGSIAAALSREEDAHSPLAARLASLLRQFLPLAALSSGVVVASGVLRGRPLANELAIAGTLALGAVPEGLPLLAGMGEVAVARRLAGRRAIVRRLGAVEALGRVDVACTDKTGTLTEGRLALCLVAGSGEEARLENGDQALSASLSQVLLTAAIASPHPEASDAGAHPTDVAVLKGAIRAGLEDELYRIRHTEVPFDPTRSFHATVTETRVCLKGAPEEVAGRCVRIRGADGADEPLDEAGREALLSEAEGFASRGLRMLMVAEGGKETDPSDPRDLTALGLIGIRDPLRAGVPEAVRRCRNSGVRVIMLTGDHPATARAIAEEAGILEGGGEVIAGSEISELHNGDLDDRLEHVAVIARVTPLDKLRVVESLKRRGHTVAMTGDGVNDGPALRLADVGVAMGRGGTEVARQASDLVLLDDDFSTLVEALVEGRSFWRNVRRALGLLLGGNVGEVGLVVAVTAAGFASPLNSRQILAMNLITDGLPALAVVLQRPEHRRLEVLSREGSKALEGPLRRDVLRRGVSTLVPSLAAFALAAPMGLAQARSIAFAATIASQLSQTWDAGQSEFGLTPSVLVALGGSSSLLFASVLVPPLRAALGMAAISASGWALVAGASLLALAISRVWKVGTLPEPKALPPRSARSLPAPAYVL